MTRSVSTNFGEPLSTESKKLVDEIRLKINQAIHPNFDNDFNIYRFVLACERVLKKKKDVVDTAVKVLNNHLRIRKAFNLDNLPDLPFPENPMYSLKLFPMGNILNVTDNHNRLLWYVEYKTVNVEAIAHTVRSSESIRLQFRQFEHMLKRVNQQEQKTGRLSGLRHIIDLNGYEINPFTMIFATNGNLAYFSQLLHFDNYPELVSPVEMVNTSKWIHLPYKIARTMMPDSFIERFRLHNENFLPNLLKEIKIEDIPATLGGKNEEIQCQPAEQEQRVKPKSLESPSNLETITILPGKRRQIYVDIKEKGNKLQWYFTTDSDISFGVFYEPPHQILSSNEAITGMRQGQEINTDELEMVYPWLKLSAKLVPEVDSIECTTPGRYWIIICNKSSWMRRKTVNLVIQLVYKDSGYAKQCHSDGTFGSCSKPFVADYLL
uniref:CRAL-TRIO domain-containing protein n=2 Tax=Wuchereria bancrofti TaxID=6293 RepID=A0AAF5RTT1_WUCBA